MLLEIFNLDSAYYIPLSSKRTVKPTITTYDLEFHIAVGLL
jgi:hypothetical protein